VQLRLHRILRVVHPGPLLVTGVGGLHPQVAVVVGVTPSCRLIKWSYSASPIGAVNQ
jgi:hypothetical protein